MSQQFSVVMQKQMMVVALHEIFKKRTYFDICRVDSLFKATGASLPYITREWLHTLHCVNYSDMPAGMREEMARVVIAALHESFPEIEVTLEEAVPPEPSKQPTFLQRLLKA